MTPAAAFSAIVNAEARAVSLSRLDADFLAAVIEVCGSPPPESIREYVRAQICCATVPRRIVGAFFNDPSMCHTLRDVAKALGVSPLQAKRVVVKAGFGRAAHLWTHLRAHSWEWFEAVGLDASSFAAPLGISERSTFRRSCTRADCGLPWLTRSGGQ